MTAAGGGGSSNKMLLCLQERACRMGAVQNPREADAAFQAAASRGVKALVEDTEDPARAASSAPGISCLHLPWKRSSSRAAAVSGERACSPLLPGALCFS